VLDAEAVAIDRLTGKLMPFQELSRRKRKDVKVEDIQVRVCLFAFDLLYLNGEVSIFRGSPILLSHLIYSRCCKDHCTSDENF
jgi:ATP-dependent DNA ligase